MTEYLLDTHALLWLSTDDERVSERVRNVVLNADNRLWVSAATVWELVIKKSLGRLEVGGSLESYLEGQRDALGFRLLPIATEDALGVEALPWHHRDPFDRLLIAQAMKRRMKLLSRDPNMGSYDVEVLWT